VNDGNDENTPTSHAFAPFRPRGFPATSERLIRERFVSREMFGRIFETESASWKEILSMDEAALDAELGTVERAAMDRMPVCGTANRPAGRRLHVVETAEPPPQPAPYRHHYQMRLAGFRDGVMASRTEIDGELRRVQRLLMESPGGFVLDVFKNLGEYLKEARLLLIEKRVGGDVRLEGCIAFGHHDLYCVEGPAGLVRRRVNVIRLLATRESEHRSLLAERLCYEAQLRGTIRAMQVGSGPSCVGTLGIVREANGRALKRQLGDRMKLLFSRSKAAALDPVLAALRDEIGTSEPYSFVIADRLQMTEAARLHLLGIGPFELRQDHPDLRIDYEVNDAYAMHVRKAAIDLANRNREALRLFGLSGPCEATIWGPPATSDMGIEASSGTAASCG